MSELESFRELLVRIDERTLLWHEAMFGKNGLVSNQKELEVRIRSVEQDSAAIKAKAGLIAAGISIAIAAIVAFWERLVR